MFQFIRELNLIYAGENKDSDSNCGHTNVDKPVYKSFEFIDIYRELKDLDEDENDRKNGDRVVGNQGGAESLMNESEESRGRRKIYHRRNVQDCDTPEMVAFLEDSNYCNLYRNVFWDSETVCQDDSLVEDRILDRQNVISTVNNSDSEGTDSTDDTKDRQHLSMREDDSEDVEDETDKVLVDRSTEQSCNTNDTCLKNEEKGTNMNTNDTQTSEDCSHVLETENLESGILSERSKTWNQSLENGDYYEDLGSDPPSGPIEHSGSIPNSGSIRSSNSTTSACSFAFPILASDWAGSPVKLANTDNRQWPSPPTAHRKEYKRPLRWRLLFCCKSIEEH